MYDLNSVDIDARKLIERHYILRVVIFYIQKISCFTIRILLLFSFFLIFLSILALPPAVLPPPVPSR